MKYYKKPIFVGSLVIVILLLCGGVFYVAYNWRNHQSLWVESQLKEENASSNLSTDSNRVVPVSSSSGEGQTTTSTLSTSGMVGGLAQTSDQVPVNVKAVITNFYLYFQKQDKDAIGQLFTVDVSNADKQSHSSLFQGVDLSGNSSTPILFVSASANQWVKEYSVIEYSKLSDTSYLVTVKEQRMNSNNVAIGEKTSFLKIISSEDKWLIDAYYLSGNIGKYNAFLAQ